MILFFQRFFSTYRWEITGALLLVVVLMVNRFPEGYVIAGEDTFQHINMIEHYYHLFYEWQGRASLFYGIFFILDFFLVSETTQLSWYLGIFLFGSYVSFLSFTRLVFGKIDHKIAVLSALFYALNLYTLYIFTYSWGYSDFQILYVFLPLLTGLYIHFLRSMRLYDGALFLLFLFFASNGFANPAFAISSALFFVFLTVCLIFTHAVVFNRRTVIGIILISVLSIFVSAYWILPIVPQVSKGVQDLAETNSIDLGWWLQKTSNPLSETLRLGQFNSGSFFPLNNPYVGLPLIKPIILALSFLPILLILFGCWRTNTRQFLGNNYFWAFFVLFLLFAALNARVRPPFDGINNFIFHLPGLSALRSYEKIAIFTPFLMAVLLMLTLLRSWIGRLRHLVMISMIVILLLPLPFYFGKIQQNMSFIFSQRSKDFQKSSHSFLVKIPDQYYSIRDIINGDKQDFKIASLPYNTDKLGWSSYPKWKMRGNDITAALYKAPIINPNGYYIGQWLFAKDLNQREENPIWAVELLGILNAKYLVYHKDVNDEFIEQSEEKIQYLELAKIISRLEDNEYFTLYQIKDEYVAPYIYASPQDVSFRNYSIEGVIGDSEKVRASWEPLSYEVIHPKKLRISLTQDTTGKNIVLNERYDSLWQAVYYGDTRIPLERVSDMNHANIWSTDESMKNGTVVVEYLPVKLFFVGAWVSGSAVFIVIMYLMYEFYERRRKKI